MATRCQRWDRGLSKQWAAYLSGCTSVQKYVVYCWQSCRYSADRESSASSLAWLASQRRICVRAWVKRINSPPAPQAIVSYGRASLSWHQMLKYDYDPKDWIAY